MTIVDFSKVVKIKKAVNEKFGEYLHFHDSCAGQYFNLENTTPEIVEFIKEFVQTLGYTATFDNDGLIFTLTN